MNADEKRLVLGALDSLAVALAEYDHEWTEGERAIYEEAAKLCGWKEPEEDGRSRCPGE